MVKSTTFPLCAALCFGLIGCAPQHVAYHSSADIPYQTTSTDTEMDLIGEDDEDASKREYAVFVAEDTEDNGTRSYALLATASKMGYSFEDANLQRSVPLTQEEALELTNGAKKALKLRDESQAEGEGLLRVYPHARTGDQPCQPKRD